MALIVEFICELPNGVHARPASHVETLCNTFSSQIEWHNLRTDRKGNAKSALALIGTDTLVGDNCQLLISGADEQEAYHQFRRRKRGWRNLIAVSAASCSTRQWPAVLRWKWNTCWRNSA